MNVSQPNRDSRSYLLHALVLALRKTAKGIVVTNLLGCCDLCHMTLCSRTIVIAVTLRKAERADNGRRWKDVRDMRLHRWFGSNLEYARKLANSGLEGAARGQKEFLKGEPVAPFLAEAARQAAMPAVVGMYLGALSAGLGARRSTDKRNPAGRTLACSLLGAAIGFGAGLAWRTQGLAANMARRSLENTRPVRDERWLKRHPINYA